MFNFKYDFYKVLRLPHFSEYTEIKLAFRRLALKYHPDKNNGQNEELMKLINIAYQTFTKQKEQYDYWLKLQLGLIQRQGISIRTEFAWGQAVDDGDLKNSTVYWTFTGGGTTANG